MPFKIKVNKELGNVFGTTEKTVETLSYEKGCIVAGNYYIPLHNVLFVKTV